MIWLHVPQTYLFFSLFCEDNLYIIKGGELFTNKKEITALEWTHVKTTEAINIIQSSSPQDIYDHV